MIRIHRMLRRLGHHAAQLPLTTTKPHAMSDVIGRVNTANRRLTVGLALPRILPATAKPSPKPQKSPIPDRS